MRAVIYARYSSDLQNASSIEDQIRVCEEYAANKGYDIVNHFTDAAISGVSLNRPGIQMLLQSAATFDVVLCEAMDRLSRDQADIALVHKTLNFQNVKIVTLDDGEVSAMHIGLKGTMSALFIQQLSDKTRRGLRGKVENSKSAGGIVYGYDVVKAFDGAGNPIKGEREINQVEANIVVRIFEDYVNLDKSPKAIASELNKEGIPSPTNKEWAASTINGNRRRGTGILNNELYIGRLIWNKLKYIKHPVTGKRQSRINPESEWIIKDVPELRILTDELWQAVKDKQKALDAKSDSYTPKRRATYLLSDLIKCSSCGGGVSLVNSTQYGCSRSRNKGTCDNRKTIRKTIIESAVLNAIKSELLNDEIVQIVVNEYNKHISELANSHRQNADQNKAEVVKLETEKNNLIDAIKKGAPPEIINSELISISERLEKAKLKLVKPKLATIKGYGIADKFKDYLSALDADSLEGEAKLAARSLIEKLELKPSGEADLYLNPWALIKKRPAINSESLPLVAGAGFEPTTFGL
ncbi:recombinase family protein [Alteromonadaceae bacterium M269]|nr:recombinase family protein [Alteromonadaceae bacterium M269]